jgi:hypothetical protein
MCMKRYCCDTCMICFVMWIPRYVVSNEDVIFMIRIDGMRYDEYMIDNVYWWCIVHVYTSMIVWLLGQSRMRWWLCRYYYCMIYAMRICGLLYFCVCLEEKTDWGCILYISRVVDGVCICFTVLRGMELVCIMLMRRLRVYKCLATTVMMGRILSRVVIASIMQSVMWLDMIVIRW